VAPWNKYSFLYGLLTKSYKLHPSFMVECLQESVYIYNSDTFLEFFKEKPKLFLVRLPLSVPDLLNYHQALYTSSIVARYLLARTHMNQRIDELAESYDTPFSEDNPLHMEVLRGIGRYYHQMATWSKPEFQDTFNFTLARLNSTASLRESFDNFNASVGRRVTSTPPAPASAMEYQQSPIVEPRSPQDRFTNVPPYARVGPTYENQHCQQANVPFQAGQPSADPNQIPPTVVLTHPPNLNLPQIKGGYHTYRMMIMIRPRFRPTCSARKRSLRKRRRKRAGGIVDEDNEDNVLNMYPEGEAPCTTRLLDAVDSCTR
jgi:hypothetical protein